MKKEKNKRLKLLLILLLVVTVGYALISTALQINGSARFAGQSWNVYWANPQVTEGSKSMVKPTIVDDGANSRNAKVVWNVNFELPGEYYEFTIDAVNAGDINAVITGIDTTVTPELPEYISYTVTNLNGSKLKENQGLKAATDGVPTVQTYKVRIEYLVDKMDASTINAMDDDVTLTYNFGITYSRSTFPPMNDKELSQEELETFVALVEENPDIYRNPFQDPSNRDIGIDMYGNVLNLDDYRAVPSIQVKNISMPYYLSDDHVVLQGSSFTGINMQSLRWATASEYIEDGKWLLTLPAYIYLTGDDAASSGAYGANHFYPVTEMSSFLGGDYSRDGRSEDKKISTFPSFPYTITSITHDSFRDMYTLEGPITISKNIVNIESDAFMCAFKNNTTELLRLHSSYDGNIYIYDCSGQNPLELEYYD